MSRCWNTFPQSKTCRMAPRLKRPSISSNAAIPLVSKNIPSGKSLRKCWQPSEPLSFQKYTCETLDTRLGEVCKCLPNVLLGGVSGLMLQAWLDEMKGSGRTKQNYLSVVTSLFRFAIRRKYLPKDAIEEVEAKYSRPKKTAARLRFSPPPK